MIITVNSILLSYLSLQLVNGQSGVNSNSETGVHSNSLVIPSQPPTTTAAAPTTTPITTASNEIAPSTSLAVTTPARLESPSSDVKATTAEPVKGLSYAKPSDTTKVDQITSPSSVIEPIREADRPRNSVVDPTLPSPNSPTSIISSPNPSPVVTPNPSLLPTPEPSPLSIPEPSPNQPNSRPSRDNNNIPSPPLPSPESLPSASVNPPITRLDNSNPSLPQLPPPEAPQGSLKSLPVPDVDSGDRDEEISPVVPITPPRNTNNDLEREPSPVVADKSDNIDKVESPKETPLAVVSTPPPSKPLPTPEVRANNLDSFDQSFDSNDSPKVDPAPRVSPVLESNDSSRDVPNSNDITDNSLQMEQQEPSPPSVTKGPTNNFNPPPVTPTKEADPLSDLGLNLNRPGGLLPNKEDKPLVDLGKLTDNLGVTNQSPTIMENQNNNPSTDEPEFNNPSRLDETVPVQPGALSPIKKEPELTSLPRLDETNLVQPGALSPTKKEPEPTSLPRLDETNLVQPGALSPKSDPDFSLATNETPSSEGNPNLEDSNLVQPGALSPIDSIVPTPTTQGSENSSLNRFEDLIKPNLERPAAVSQPDGSDSKTTIGSNSLPSASSTGPLGIDNNELVRPGALSPKEFDLDGSDTGLYNEDKGTETRTGDNLSDRPQPTGDRFTSNLVQPGTLSVPKPSNSVIASDNNGVSTPTGSPITEIPNLVQPGALSVSEKPDTIFTSGGNTVPSEFPLPNFSDLVQPGVLSVSDNNQNVITSDTNSIPTGVPIPNTSSLVRPGALSEIDEPERSFTSDQVRPSSIPIVEESVRPSLTSRNPDPSDNTNSSDVIQPGASTNTRDDEYTPVTSKVDPTPTESRVSSDVDSSLSYKEPDHVTTPTSQAKPSGHVSRDDNETRGTTAATRDSIRETTTPRTSAPPQSHTPVATSVPPPPPPPKEPEPEPAPPVEPTHLPDPATTFTIDFGQPTEPPETPKPTPAPAPEPEPEPEPELEPSKPKPTNGINPTKKKSTRTLSSTPLPTQEPTETLEKPTKTYKEYVFTAPVYIPRDIKVFRDPPVETDTTTPTEREVEVLPPNMPAMIKGSVPVSELHGGEILFQLKLNDIGYLPLLMDPNKAKMVSNAIPQDLGYLLGVPAERFVVLRMMPNQADHLSSDPSLKVFLLIRQPGDSDEMDSISLKAALDDMVKNNPDALKKSVLIKYMDQSYYTDKNRMGDAVVYQGSKMNLNNVQLMNTDDANQTVEMGLETLSGIAHSDAKPDLNSVPNPLTGFNKKPKSPWSSTSGDNSGPVGGTGWSTSAVGLTLALAAAFIYGLLTFARVKYPFYFGI